MKSKSSKALADALIGACLSFVSVPAAQADTTFSEVAIAPSQPTDFTNARLTVDGAPAGFPAPLSFVTVTFSGEFTSSIILTNTSNQTQSFTATLNSVLTYSEGTGLPFPLALGISLTVPVSLYASFSTGDITLAPGASATFSVDLPFTPNGGPQGFLLTGFLDDFLSLSFFELASTTKTSFALDGGAATFSLSLPVPLRERCRSPSIAAFQLSPVPSLVLAFQV